MLEILERFHKTSVHINDKRLVAWIKLQIIAEDIESSRIKALALPEMAAGGRSGSITLSHVQTLEGKLGQWRYATEPVTNGMLKKPHALKSR